MQLSKKHIIKYINEVLDEELKEGKYSSLAMAGLLGLAAVKGVGCSNYTTPQVSNNSDIQQQQELPSEKSMDAWDLAGKYSDRNTNLAKKLEPVVNRHFGPNAVKEMIKECVIDVLKEDVGTEQHGRYAQQAGGMNISPSINEDSDATDVAVKIKRNIYPQLEVMGFKNLGDKFSDGDYMELYLSGFVTIVVMVDVAHATVNLERYYDNERLDNQYKLDKHIPIPVPYSDEFVVSILKAASRLKKAAYGDESLMGGMEDDIPMEGFDPQSNAGPNPGGTHDNPYPAWNAEMQRMEESDEADDPYRDDLSNEISDTYKELYGMRPRGIAFDTVPIEQLKSILKDLRQDLQIQWDREAEDERRHGAAIQKAMTPQKWTVGDITDLEETLATENISAE